MKYVLSVWIGSLCLAVHQLSQLPVCTVIDSYVRRIDADKTLKTKRHIHTYGHANKPGVDSLFWVYHTDFQGSSVIVYYSGSKLVKLIETARRGKDFTESSYYLKNDKLLFVKTRQANCPILNQIAAWRNQVSPCTKEADCFFLGRYYFAQNSCVSKQERGKSEWEPEYHIPGIGGSPVTVPDIYPIQAARYATIFGKAVFHKK